MIMHITSMSVSFVDFRLLVLVTMVYDGWMILVVLKMSRL